MFTVVAISFIRICSTLVGGKGEFICRSSTWYVGVHIPYLSICLLVCRLKVRPELVVSLLVMGFNDVKKSSFKRSSALSIGVVVVAGGGLGPHQ